jgi:hypothetical protein
MRTLGLGLTINIPAFLSMVLLWRRMGGVHIRHVAYDLEGMIEVYHLQEEKEQK